MLIFVLFAAHVACICATPVISGSGNFRYQYDPSKLKLPPSVQLLNGHGLTRDKAGNIYFTYESTNKDDPSVRALIRFQSDGTGGTLLGDATLAQGSLLLRFSDHFAHESGTLMWRSFVRCLPIFVIIDLQRVAVAVCRKDLPCPVKLEQYAQVEHMQLSHVWWPCMN